MEITYNNLTQAEDTISFTGFPNIIKIEEPNSGTYASAKITINNLSSVLSDTEYTLFINNSKFVSTNDINTATGNKFFISNDNTAENKITIAYKLVEAIRSSSTLPINYNITMQTSADGVLSPVINIAAKNVGEQFNLSIGGTLLSSNIITINITQGTNSSTLLQGKTNKIIVEVYKVNTLVDKLGSTTYNMGEYITTLSKEYFDDVIYFDIAPLYSSLAEYGEMSEVNLYIYLMTDNKFFFLKVFKDLYFTQGYSVNQGYPFLNKFSNLYLAQNVSRGTTKGTINNTILYVYEPHIDLSLFATAEISSTPITINYINSARTIFQTETTIFPVTSSLNNLTINLNSLYFNNAFFVDIIIKNVGSVRYNVIKPLKATDEIQRIYWTNSYGGTSFFDFTGNRSETRKTKVDYYQTNLFNYYDKDTTELNKVYNKTVNITVSLSSHNIEKDGTWQFFDLQNSTNAWTYVNNKKYFITITDLKITESSVNDIYVATIEYEYSMGDTF